MQAVEWIMEICFVTQLNMERNSNVMNKRYLLKWMKLFCLS